MKKLLKTISNMLIYYSLVPFHVLRGILKTFVYDTVHTELIGSYIYNKVHAMNVSDNPVMPFHAFRGDNSAITNTITTGDTRPDPRKFRLFAI
ncbi:MULTISPECIES: hypothetical protein [Klebsiella]|uniref:Uncharacterized protein n=1 Tax=Klebsiella michiganensis TaxID=1134687 RepID=A0AAJ1NTS3_9ENTR|nr:MULTISPECIES: hypothetical protein [Klebsiella]MBG9428450.1 hypothetical protein [Klebsiella pneumoniae]MDH0966749.1 hypothetical protein [Klebsiella michiganensis]MXK27626.1 hypothetical protein [Klebsiella pneumoniae]HBU8509654.1 hypothetical protein [Klebsiella pneumoniae]HCT6826505.1 hypothetical protein [Klebsiella pneumoniae]